MIALAQITIIIELILGNERKKDVNQLWRDAVQSAVRSVVLLSSMITQLENVLFLNSHSVLLYSENKGTPQTCRSCTRPHQIIILKSRSQAYNMAKYKYEKEFLFSPHRTDEVILFLNDNPIDLLAVRDAEKNTVLHMSSFQDNLDLLIMYIQYERRKHPGSERIPSQHFLSVINSQNGEGYSALLYAAYKGNIQIMDVLIRNHADLTLRSKKGLNIYHLAAQGDQIRTFMYLHDLRDLNKSLDLFDSEGSTPLHWAAFSGSLKIVEYLLTHQLNHIDVNSQDSSLNTALHIATLYGHTNIVKLLLKYGSNKRLKNSQGFTPEHIAINNNFLNLSNILREKRSLYETLLIYCNARQDYKPKNRSYTLPVFYIIYYTIIMALLTLTIQYDSTAVYYTQTIIFLAVYLIYISLLTSPSVPPSSTLKSLLYRKGISIHDICFSCGKLRGKREYHCYICGTCINQYDHHCFWINNCVGKHNLGRFYAFIIGDTIILIWMGVIGIILILNTFTDTSILFTNTTLFDLSLELRQLYIIIVSVILLTPFTAYAIPMIFLLMIQTMNLFLNRTTYERFSNQRSSVLGDDEPQIRLRHCCEMIGQGERKEGESDTTSDMSKIEHKLIQQS